MGVVGPGFRRAPAVPVSPGPVFLPRPSIVELAVSSPANSTIELGGADSWGLTGQSWCRFVTPARPAVSRLEPPSRHAENAQHRHGAGTARPARRAPRSPPVGRALARGAARLRPLGRLRARASAAGTPSSHASRRVCGRPSQPSSRGPVPRGREGLWPPVIPQPLLGGRAGRGSMRWDGRYPEVTVTGSGTRSHPGIRVHRTLSLEPADISRHGVIPITSVARTLVDLSSQLELQPLRRAVRQAQSMKLVELRELVELLGRLGRPRGCRKARADLGHRSRPDPQRARGHRARPDARRGICPARGWRSTGPRRLVR